MLHLRHPVQQQPERSLQVQDEVWRVYFWPAVEGKHFALFLCEVCSPKECFYQGPWELVWRCDPLREAVLPLLLWNVCSKESLLCAFGGCLIRALREYKIWRVTLPRKFSAQEQLGNSSNQCFCCDRGVVQRPICPLTGFLRSFQSTTFCVCEWSGQRTIGTLSKVSQTRSQPCGQKPSPSQERRNLPFVWCWVLLYLPLYKRGRCQETAAIKSL